MKRGSSRPSKAPARASDDWPLVIPLSEAELDLYETHLSDILASMLADEEPFA